MDRIGAILHDLGIEDYEPRVQQQLFEFVVLHVHNLLGTEQEMALHAGRDPANVQESDLRVAMGKGARADDDPMRISEPLLASGFPSKPDQAFWKALASTANERPLPDIRKPVGIPIPPEEGCLLATNFQIGPPTTP